MGLTRTAGSLGCLIGINLAVRLFNLPIAQNLLIGNHIAEAAASFAVVAFLIDLGFINGEIQKSYFKIGLIALVAGAFFVVASFSSLFVWAGFIEIIKSWMIIAPVIIFLVSLPCIYLADILMRKSTFLSMPNTGTRGLINAFVVATIYSIFAIYVLNSLNLLSL